MKIKNIPFKDFLELPEQERESYEIAIKFYDEIDNVFNIQRTELFEFKLIKDFQRATRFDMNFELLLEFFERFTGVKKRILLNYPFLSIIKFKNYLFSEIQKISDNEAARLGGRYSIEDAENPTMKRFEKLDVYIQYSELANGDVTKIQEIEKTPYFICILELEYRNLQKEFKSWKNSN